MLRILHVLERTSDFQACRSAMSLSQGTNTDVTITTRTIGRGGEDRNTLFALIALRRELAGKFDLIHVWDWGALMAAALASRRPIVFSPATLLPASSTRWLLPLMRRRVIHLVCSSAWEQNVYLRRGVLPEHCHVIRPGCQSPLTGLNRDARLRALLGFAEEDYVLFAPGESSRNAGHRTGVWAASILHVLDPGYKFLLWGRGAEAPACRRLADKLLQPNLLTIAEQKLNRRVEFEELLPAVDAVIFAPTGPAPILPLAICMADGLPIIATIASPMDGLLRHQQSAILVSRRSPRLLAQSVLELRQNPNLCSTISMGCQSIARETFKLDSDVQQYQTLYRQIQSM